MKILSASVTNFASYEHLAIGFENRGLTLVSGPTGAGKSTLCDIVPWVLFGRTAKDGAVDEIVRWNSDELTEGRIYVKINDKTIGVFRSRNPNDLKYIEHEAGEFKRGKDLNDTQKRINDLLGTDAEKYLSSAYYHEFSQAASFFTASAKNRRLMIEQMVDLSLALKIAEGTKALKSEAKEAIERLDHRLSMNLDKKEFTRIKILAAEDKASEWGTELKSKVAKLRDKNENFNRDEDRRLNALATNFIGRNTEIELELKDLRARVLPKYHFTKLQAEIKRLEAEQKHADTCPTCGHLLQEPTVNLAHLKYQLEQDTKTQDYTISQIRAAERSLDYGKEVYAKARAPQDNPYLDLIEQAEQEVSPYVSILESLREQSLAVDEVLRLQTETMSELKLKLSDTTTLIQIVDDFRSLLIKRTVAELEHSTNRLLTSHFDAEIRCKFEADSLDKLDVTILKDGNECSFSQLSKGQRQLLKLCFGVSVMRQVANHSRVSTNVAMMDEAFDGMDEVLRVKAYSLLQELATQYESVFVVDHSPGLKAMFVNNIQVSLANGVSTIEES